MKDPKFKIRIENYLDTRCGAWQISTPNISFFKTENSFSICICLFVIEIQFWFGDTQHL